LEKNEKLPKGWTSFQYDDYLTLEYGKSQTKKNRKKGKIPVYGSSGVDGYHNDALVQNPCLVIGRKGSVGEIHCVHEPCWPIDTTYFLNEHPMYELQFLFYLLKHMRLNQLDTSTAVPSLRRNDVYAIQMIVPPFNEQKRIVEKIEELLLIHHNLKKNLLEIDIKRILNFESILNDSFNGKLSKQWREHNNSKDPVLLLEKIKETQSKTGRRLKRSLYTKDFKKYDLPEKWIWSDTFSISKDLGDAPFGTSLKSKDYVNEGIPVIHGRNIKKNQLEWRYPLHVSKEKFDSLKRSHCHTGELIFQKIGSVGTIAILPEIERKTSFLLSTNAMKVSTDPELISIKYLYYYFYQKKIKQFIEHTSQGTSQPIFNFTTLKNFPIPIPSTEEQYFIVKLIDQFSSELSNLHTLLQFISAKEKILVQKILDYAFTGKLVPQDPNDEPASELLKKIKLK